MTAPIIEEFNPLDELTEPRFDGAVRTPVVQSVSFVSTVKTVIVSTVGLGLVWFGLTSTGSYFMPASRFAGVLGEIFYTYQLGTLAAIAGAILVYDSIKGYRNL